MTEHRYVGEREGGSLSPARLARSVELFNLRETFWEDLVPRKMIREVHIASLFLE